MMPRIREVRATSNTWDRAYSTDSTNTWPQSLWWSFVEGAGTDGSGSDSGGSGDSTSGDDDDATSGDTGGGEGSSDKTFTQDQLNAIVTRETQKATRGKLDPKELGFESAKDMKEWIEGQKAKADADKTEAEKEREAAIEQAKRDAEANVLSTANERIMKAEFMLAAMEHELDRTAREDAFLLAKTLEAWQGVEVDDKGVVTGFDDAFFDELKEKKPYLFKSTGDDDSQSGTGDLAGGRRGGGSDQNKETKIRSLFPALGGGQVQ